MVDKVFELEDLQRILQVSAGTEDGFNLNEAILDTTFHDLGYDSIAVLEMAGRITREYGVTIDDEALAEGITPRGFIDLVNAS